MRLVVGALAAMLVVVVAVGIGSTVRKKGDRGFLAYYLVLGPGLASVALELLLLASGPEAGYRGVLVDFARATRILLGPAWLSFCHLHYKLILGNRGLPAYRTIMAINSLSFCFFIFALALPSAQDIQNRAASVILSTTLFYAGIMAFAILRISKNLPRSSWSGIVCAGASMVYYPFIALSEAFGLSFGNFSTDYPLSLQVFPFYLCCICLIILLFLRARRVATDSMPEADKAITDLRVAPGLLTLREEEVLKLLVTGMESSAIAHALCVSLSTVKTHTRSVYSKLGLKNRRELMATRYRADAGKPPGQNP